MGYTPCGQTCPKCGQQCANNDGHVGNAGASHSCGHYY
jgi:hypothetical protein